MRYSGRQAAMRSISLMTARPRVSVVLITIRSGCLKSPIATPSRRNSEQASGDASRQQLLEPRLENRYLTTC